MIRKIDSNIFSLTILKVTTFSRIRHGLITNCYSSLWGTATKKQNVPHKSVWIARKVPHKNVIDFAISLFFSLLQQEYNNNTMSI